jgi:hypothetical protein
MFIQFDKRKLVLSTLGILIFCQTFSQRNFLPGYVINLDHDTLYGEIDYKNWSQNPKTINFQTALNGSIIIFSPSDLIRFSVKDEIYQSAEVEVETSSNNPEHLDRNPEFNIITVSAFLQVLFEGEKNLFHLTMADGKDNYYIGSSNSPLLLKFKKYLIYQEDSGGDIIQKSNHYQGQLTYYLDDCRNIATKVAATEYKKLEFEKLFDYYYSCAQSELAFKKRVEKTHYKFGLIAGISRTNLIFEGEHKYIGEAQFDESIDFLAGTFLEIVFPRNMRRWSIYNELQYGSYFSEGEYVRFDQPDYYSGYIYQLGSNYLRLTNLLRFNYQLGKLTGFLGAGFSNDIALKVTNTETYITRNSTEETQRRENPALESPRNHQQAFVVGTGLRFNHCQLELRYQLGNGMSPYLALQSKVRDASVILSYRF